MGVRRWLVERLGGGDLARLVDERVRAAVLVKDDEFWHDMTRPEYLARPWHEQRDLLETCRELCDENPLAARIVAMGTDFTVGKGARVTGDAWALSFWEHRQNRIDRRLYRWCDELTRSGELFLVLSRNDADGMSYVREVPAYLVDQVETDPDDAEVELRYHQLTDEVEGRWWAALPASGPGPGQVMLHFCVNKPVGDVRGTSDLAQITDWLERYDMWLEDRVRINRYKGAYLWHVKVEGAMPGQLEAKRVQYSRPPTSGSIIVSDGTETWEPLAPQIGADDVESDGKAIRLMIAAGSGIPLHFLAEGDTATRATAREMGTATFRHFSHRQMLLAQFAEDVVRAAAQQAGLAEPDISVVFEDVMQEAERRDEPRSSIDADPIPAVGPFALADQPWEEERRRREPYPPHDPEDKRPKIPIIIPAPFPWPTEPMKHSISQHDERVCAVCVGNEAAGWVPYNEPYPDGSMHAPFHRKCRCSEVLAGPPVR